MVNIRPIEELPPEIADIATQALRLRERNAEFSNEIEGMGGNVEVATARVEHILASLVELGIITEEQMWKVNLDWERALRTQLRDVRDRMREMYREAERLQREKRFEKKLIIPGQNGN